MSPDAKELRVLILEGTPADAELMANALKHVGLVLQWQRVDTRAAFVAALAESHPDIVLANQHLPALPGREALAIVRQTHPDIPLIIVMGLDSDEVAVEMMHLGADDYILKDNQLRLGQAVVLALTTRRDTRVRGIVSQAFQLSELRYRRLFEAAQDGILLLNAVTGQIEDVNPFLIDMLEYTHSEFLGKKLWEVGAFKNTTLSKQVYEELKKENYVRYEDMPLQARDGRLIDVEFVSNVYACGDTRVIQCNIRDITVRKQSEAKLREQLDELLRFEKVTIGREERMQTLKKENARLTARLAELEHNGTGSK